MDSVKLWQRARRETPPQTLRQNPHKTHTKVIQNTTRKRGHQSRYKRLFTYKPITDTENGKNALQSHTEPTAADQLQRPFNYTINYTTNYTIQII